MKDFRKLKVWGRAHRLALAVYQTTRTFPKDELYGLTSQIRRSAASVCANVAEGCGRRGDRELARFCQVALGSASELEYHLLLAADLKYVDRETYDQLVKLLTEVKRMLFGFIRKLTADS